MKQKPDMRGAWLRQGPTQREAESEAILPLVAGSDTTATAIRIFLLHVLSNTAAYDKLQREIDQGIQSRLISDPIKQSEAKKLPYLQALIQEALRICSPAVGMAAKVVPPEGDSIHGYFVPGGTWTGTNFWSINRSEEVFGSNIDEYNLDRWLNISKEKRTRMTRTVDFIFSYGRYKCFRAPIAWLELEVFVELLRNFDISLIDASKPMVSIDHGVWIQSGLMVKIIKRCT